MTRHDLVADWLAGALPAGRRIGDWLAELSAWERIALVREVMDARPALARAVQRMSVVEQLQLSVELVAGTARHERVQVWSARCFARQVRGRRRRLMQ